MPPKKRTTKSAASSKTKTSSKTAAAPATRRSSARTKKSDDSDGQEDASPPVKRTGKAPVKAMATKAPRRTFFKDIDTKEEVGAFYTQNKKFLSLNYHTESVTFLRVIDDKLYSGSADGKVAVWDIYGQKLETFCHPDGVKKDILDVAVQQIKSTEYMYVATNSAGDGYPVTWVFKNGTFLNEIQYESRESGGDDWQSIETHITKFLVTPKNKLLGLCDNGKIYEIKYGRLHEWQYSSNITFFGNTSGIVFVGGTERDLSADALMCDPSRACIIGVVPDDDEEDETVEIGDYPKSGANYVRCFDKYEYGSSEFDDNDNREWDTDGFGEFEGVFGTDKGIYHGEDKITDEGATTVAVYKHTIFSSTGNDKISVWDIQKKKKIDVLDHDGEVLALAINNGVLYCASKGSIENRINCYNAKKINDGIKGKQYEKLTKNSTTFPDYFLYC